MDLSNIPLVILAGGKGTRISEYSKTIPKPMIKIGNKPIIKHIIDYYEYYGVTPDKLDHAKSDALIMHPGPMNRGIEIDTRLADDINKSVIKEQVELGVAVRMACLKIFCE